MHHEGGNSERFASLQLVRDRRDAPAAQLGVRRCQVGEVTRVGDDRIDAAGRPGRPESRDLRARKRPGRPLTLILDEDLQAVAADGDRPLERLMQPAGDRRMSAETALAIRQPFRSLRPRRLKSAAL